MLKTSKLLKIIGAACLSVGAISICALAVNHSKTPVVEETEAADYYASIGDELEGSSLITALHTLNVQNKKTNYSYQGLRDLFQYVDKCDGSNGKIVGFYNNALVGPAWDSGSTWNREHVWPESHGGDKVEGDLHMVMPTSTSINSERGNKYYGTESSTYDAGKYVAEYRGIAARIIFYCAIADTSLTLVDSTSGSSNQMGKLSTLLQWNLDYLPNTSSSSLAYKTEQYRNETIGGNATYGGNRNPFIDHPEYACRIWGDTNADTRSICGTSSTPSVTLSKTTVNLEPGASETITATINNGSGTISWTSSNENVATVSGGTITAKSTATVGQTAEITASVTISGTPYSKKCTVTIVSSGGSGGGSSGDGSVATSISVGDTVTLISQDASMEMTSISNTSTKYGVGTSYSTTPSCSMAFTVAAGNSTGTYSFINGSNYLYWGGGNSLNISSSLSSATSWNVSFDSSGNATILNASDSTRQILWNSNSPRFACYSGQTIGSTYKSVQLYKLSSGGSSTDPTLSSISVKTAPTKTSYTSGENFNPAGLVINRVFSDTSYNDTYTYSGHTSEFTFSPTTNTALKTSDTSVTITYGGKSCSQSITVSPTSITASVSKTYYVGETISSSDITVKDNDNQTVSGFTFANDGYQFQYSDAASGGALTNKAFANSITKGSLKASLTVQVQRKAYVQPSQSVDVSDEITADDLVATNTTYKPFSDLSKTSSAVYAGTTAKTSSGGIQLRSKNSDSGIYSTTSGGTIKSVTITVESGSNTLDVYGKNTAYTSVSDLYDSSKQGTKIGSRSNSGTITVTGSYTFIGIRSNNGAIYLTSLVITYAGSGSGEQTAANVANYIMYEDTNNQCNTKYSVAKGYFESMSASERNTFMTSSDYVISTARARLQAWAASKGETISQSGGSYVIGNNSRINPIHTNSTTILLVVCIFSTLAGLTFIALSIKKRKEK